MKAKHIISCFAFVILLAIQIQISPMLLKSVASLYSDPHRVIMEYLDNAIDAAESFYVQSSDTYSKPIEISITFDGKSYDYARIVIHDNCTGINNLSDLVTKVGNSSKLKDESTNGQFGFGIYSYLAICDSLIITTRLSNTKTISRVELSSKMFESPESGVFNVITEQPNISGYELNEARVDCWSRFKLEGFNKQSFKELSVRTLKTEIENHFELILSRKNIVVKIIDNNKKEHVCTSFNYDKYEGEVYFKEIDALKKTKSKKFKSKESISIANKVVIFLKVSKDRMLDRKPVFIIKGRRITNIVDVKSFRTNSKSLIWGHPNVTGYIDVTGVLEPKISRDDFKPNDKSKALFQTLLGLEDEIKEFITSQLKLPSSNEYRNLEEFLSNTLKKLNESKKFRNLINFETGNKQSTKKEDSDNHIVDSITLTVPKRISSSDGVAITPTPSQEVVESTPGEREDTYESDSDTISTVSKNKEIALKEVVVKLESTAKDATHNDTTKNSNRTKGSINGISIVIDCDNEPPSDSNDVKLRSSMINNQIIIYKKHPMFKERTRGSYLGVKTISNELIFYISLEIITQIKILVYNENKDSIADVGAFFHKYSEGVYLFVSELTKLAGKNLSELTNLN